MFDRKAHSQRRTPAPKRGVAHRWREAARAFKMSSLGGEQVGERHVGAPRLTAWEDKSTVQVPTEGAHGAEAVDMGNVGFKTLQEATAVAAFA